MGELLLVLSSWCWLRLNLLSTIITARVMNKVIKIVPSKLSTMVAILIGWFSGSAGVRGSSWVVHLQMGHMVHLCRILFVQFERWQGIAQSKSKDKWEYVTQLWVWTYFTSQSKVSQDGSKLWAWSWGTGLKKNIFPLKNFCFVSHLCHIKLNVFYWSLSTINRTLIY